MTCHQLAQRIAGLRPDFSPVEVARLTLMILARSNDERLLTDDEELYAEWRNATFRLEAVSDQHAAVAIELERLQSDSRVGQNGGGMKQVPGGSLLMDGTLRRQRHATV